MRLLFALALAASSLPAAAQSTQESPTLSVSDRLDDRRYVATVDRAYVAGTEAGRFPAMGFHTCGEMGVIWTPVKLLDGRRAVLVDLEFRAGSARRTFDLKMDAHSELMSRSW